MGNVSVLPFSVGSKKFPLTFLFFLALFHTSAFGSYEILKEEIREKSIIMSLRLSTPYLDYLKNFSGTNLGKIFEAFPRIKKMQTISTEALNPQGTEVEHFVQLFDISDTYLSQSYFKISEVGFCTNMSKPETCPSSYHFILQGPVATSYATDLFPQDRNKPFYDVNSFVIKFSAFPEKDTQGNLTQKAILQYEFSIENNDYKNYFSTLIKLGKLQEMPSQSQIFSFAKILGTRAFQKLF